MIYHSKQCAQHSTVTLLVNVSDRAMLTVVHMTYCGRVLYYNILLLYVVVINHQFVARLRKKPDMRIHWEVGNWKPQIRYTRNLRRSKTK